MSNCTGLANLPISGRRSVNLLSLNRNSRRLARESCRAGQLGRLDAADDGDHVVPGALIKLYGVWRVCLGYFVSPALLRLSVFTMVPESTILDGMETSPN